MTTPMTKPVAKPKKKSMTPKQLAVLVAKAADDVQGIDIQVLDLTALTSFTDYFIICSGKSSTQVKAIADSILKSAKDRGRLPLGMEGHQKAEWILVDFGDVVAHVFYNEFRPFYNLEKLWGDAAKLIV